ERLVGAGEVRIEAREGLLALEPDAHDVGELAVTVELEVDVGGLRARVDHLEEHLVAALVERIASNRKTADGDVSGAAADLDEAELRLAEIDRTEAVARVAERAVGHDDDLGFGEPRERIDGEAQPAGPV